MKRLGLVVVLTLFAVQSASAQSSDWKSRQYIGITIGAAFENFDDTGSLDIDESIVLGAQLGFRFKNEFGSFQPALDLKIRWYDGFDIEDDGEIDGWSVSLRPKVYIGTGMARPYVFAGVGWMDASLSIDGSSSVSDNDLLLEIGGGVELAIGRWQGFFAEINYVWPQGNLDGLDMFEVGIGYNFQF